MFSLYLILIFIFFIFSFICILLRFQISIFFFFFISFLYSTNLTGRSSLFFLGRLFRLLFLILFILFCFPILICLVLQFAFFLKIRHHFCSVSIFNLISLNAWLCLINLLSRNNSNICKELLHLSCLRF